MPCNNNFMIFPEQMYTGSDKMRKTTPVNYMETGFREVFRSGCGNFME